MVDKPVLQGATKLEEHTAVLQTVHVDSLWSRAFRRFRAHRLAMVGVGIMVIFIALAVAAPLVTRHTPYAVNGKAILKPPNWEYILGTDQAGRDQWSRLVYGARISLQVGIIAVSIYMSIGFVIGSMAGLVGGKVDLILMRFSEMMMCFPTLILILLLVGILGPNIRNVMLVIGLFGWPGVDRLIRGQILSLREQDFVLAARTVGAGDWHIITRHLLPNVVGPIIVTATMGIAGAILTEAGLSFLGFGVRPPTPSWGLMINEAKGIATLANYPWLWIPPGVAISVSVLAVNFIGDGLRDALDVRSRLRG